MQFIVIVLVGLCIVGGLKWIERMNVLLVSLLLIIIIITFSWALSLKYADIGVQVLFTPNWGRFIFPTASSD